MTFPQRVIDEAVKGLKEMGYLAPYKAAAPSSVSIPGHVPFKCVLQFQTQKTGDSSPVFVAVGVWEVTSLTAVNYGDERERSDRPFTTAELWELYRI